MGWQGKQNGEYTTFLVEGTLLLFSCDKCCRFLSSHQLSSLFLYTSLNFPLYLAPVSFSTPLLTFLLFSLSTSFLLYFHFLLFSFPQVSPHYVLRGIYAQRILISLITHLSCWPGVAVNEQIKKTPRNRP